MKTVTKFVLAAALGGVMGFPALSVGSDQQGFDRASGIQLVGGDRDDRDFRRFDKDFDNDRFFFRRDFDDDRFFFNRFDDDFDFEDDDD
jgi:hypothetical protein